MVLKMDLTPRERAILDLLRVDPQLTAGNIASRLGTTRSAVNVHLTNLRSKGAIRGRGYLLRSLPVAVVIGGANMDVKAHSHAPLEAGTSNPGRTSISPGGVGRNVAEGLARLGTDTHLVAAVGDDAMGRQILDVTEQAGVRVEQVSRTAAVTGTYTAVLDHHGELTVAVSDMDATEMIDAHAIENARGLIGSADLLILDGNLSHEALGAALAIGRRRKVRIVLEPVSVPKARRLGGLLDGSTPIHTITPNVAELGALVGRPVDDDVPDLGRAAANLHDRDVDVVWIRRGGGGSVISTRAAGITDDHVFAALPTDVVDVTGAGDAMLAAFAHAILAGHSLRRAAGAGHAAAAATIASPHTVRPDLSERLIDHHRSDQ